MRDICVHTEEATLSMSQYIYHHKIRVTKIELLTENYASLCTLEFRFTVMIKKQLVYTSSGLFIADFRQKSKVLVV